ncbi:hypothetical protein F5051DRAFT_162158 [Lentinula edodes]|nr:hypothetical protein F5051DRAFT_162158 [Lentinula edodes]
MSKTPMPRSPPRRVSVANTAHSHSNDLRKMALIGAHFHGNQRHRNHPAIETQLINNPQPLPSSSNSILQHPSTNRDLQNHPVAGPSGQASQLERNAGEQLRFFHPQGYGGPGSASDELENTITWDMMNQQLAEQMSVSNNDAWTNSQAVAAALASHQNSYSESSPQAVLPSSQPHSHAQQLGYHAPDAFGTTASQSPSTSSFPRVYGWMPRSEEDLKPIARIYSRYQPARAVTPLVPSTPQQHSPTNTRRTSMTTRPTVPVTARSIAIPIHNTERHSGSIPVGSSQTLQMKGAGSSRRVFAPSPLDSSLSSPVPATPSTSTSPARHSRVSDKRWDQGQSMQRAHPSQRAAQSPPRIRNANLSASSHPQTQTSLKDRDSLSLSVGKAGSPQSRVQQNPVSFPRTSNTAPRSDTPSTPARLSPIPPSPHLFRFFAPGQKQYQQFQHQPIFSSSSHPPQSSNLGPSQPSLHLQPLLLQPAIELRKIAGRKRKAKREVQGEDLGSDWSSHDSPTPNLYQSPGDSAASPILIRSRSSSPVLPFETSVEYPLTYSSPSVSSSITIAASSSSVSPASSCSTAGAVASSASSSSSPSKPPLKIVPHSTFPPNPPFASELASIVNSKTIDPHLLHCTGPPKRKKPRLNSHELTPPAPTVQEMMLEVQEGWDEKERHEREAREKEQKELKELEETRENLMEALKDNEIKRNLVEGLKQISNGAVDPRVQAAHIKLILAVLLAKPSTSPSPPPNTASAPWVPMMTESVLEFDIERDITRSSTFGRCSVTRRCQVPPLLLSNINHSKNSVCLCTRSSRSPFPFSSTPVSKPISSSASSPSSLYPIWKPVWVGGRKI